MLDYSLNIAGSEWMIIIFVAIVLILGTGKLPGVAKKLGKAVNEYNKAKNEIQDQMKVGEEQAPKNDLIKTCIESRNHNNLLIIFWFIFFLLTHLLRNHFSQLII